MAERPKASLAASIAEAVGAAYEKHKEAGDVSPAWLATLAMMEIEFPRELHEPGYLGCHLYLRQIARGLCGKKFDPVQAIKEDDLFPETLQQRYPKKPSKNDEEPVYRLLNLLSADDVTYNQKTGELEARGGVRIKLETQN
jgi:hypothetical protein